MSLRQRGLLLRSPSGGGHKTQSKQLNRKDAKNAKIKAEREFNAKALSRKDAKMDDRKNEIVQTIEASFADIPYPQDDQIGQSHEQDFIEEHFSGKKWQDISVETLFKCRTDLVYFTDNAFRYFLPAFMIGVILYEYKTDTLATNLISQLTPPVILKDYLSSSSLDGLTKRFLAQAEMFSMQEIQAIIGFLSFYADLHKDDGYETQEILIDEAIGFWKSRIP